MRTLALCAGIGGYEMPKGHYVRTYRPPRKVYPTDMVELVRDLYLTRGLSQMEVAAETGTTLRVVQKLMRNHDIPSRRPIKRNQTGPANTNWKADKAGYAAMHLRLQALYGKPSKCERCGTDDPAKTYDWANMTGHYEDVTDYKRMCRSCHWVLDGKVNNLHRRAV